MSAPPQVLCGPQGDRGPGAGGNGGPGLTCAARTSGSPTRSSSSRPPPRLGVPLNHSTPGRCKEAPRPH